MPGLGWARVLLAQVLLAWALYGLGIVRVHHHGTPTPVPTMYPYTPPGYPPATRHLAGSLLGASLPVHDVQTAHQAHAVRMEILSKQPDPDTVSRTHNWPAPDVLTTLQTRGNTRRLIVRNTKDIFPIWEQREIFP